MSRVSYLDTMSKFFLRNTEKPNSSGEGQETKRDEKKKIVKKDLVKLKWKHIKPKRGYRDGIYPKWSRLRARVYKRGPNVFQSAFILQIDRMRTTVTKAPVHPVRLTRSKSCSTVLKLRPPNDHKH
eukprot:151080_1